MILIFNFIHLVSSNVSFNAIYDQAEFERNFKYLCSKEYDLPKENTRVLKTANRKLHFGFQDKQDQFQLPQFHANLVTFTAEILNGKLHFLCSDRIAI